MPPVLHDFKTHATISEADKSWVSANIYHTIHTRFAHFPSLPFRASYFSDAGWVVTRSSIPSLPQGAIIKEINHQDFNEWAKQQKEYIAASSERAGHSVLFYNDYLWPERFTLSLEKGQKVNIDRQKRTEKIPRKASKFSVKMIEPNVYLLNLPTFSDPSVEKEAQKFLIHHKNAKAILFNVIGNAGGTSPDFLMNAIQTQSYQSLIAEKRLKYRR